MKSILLGLAISAFAVSSALAGGCSYGSAKMSHSTKTDSVAQSQPVDMPSIKKNVEVAALKDAWLINFLDKA